MSKEKYHVSWGVILFHALTMLCQSSAGEYTLVVSSFRAGQLGEYALRIECDASVDITHLSSEGAGMFHKTVKGAW